MTEDPVATVTRVLVAADDADDPGLVLTAEAQRAASELADSLASRPDNMHARYVLGWWHWYRYIALPDDKDQEAWGAAAEILTPCFVADVENLPDGLVPVLAHHAADEAEDILADAIATDDAAAVARAATLWRRVVAATPPDNPCLPGMLTNLSAALQAQYAWTGDSVDLETAIAALRRAVPLMASAIGNDEAVTLSNLAGALSARFSASGHTDDLDEAIEMMRRAVAVVGPAHLAYQTNLGSLPAVRYQRRGARSDIDEAISGLMEAVSIPRESLPPELPVALSNLGAIVRLLANRTNDDAAVELAVRIGTLAVEVLPHGHPGRHRAISNLAGDLGRRAARTGNSADLHSAVQLGQEAVACAPLRHQDAVRARANLAGLLTDRFEHSGGSADLDTAIEILKEIADASLGGACPVSAVYWAGYGRALMRRHQQLGAGPDLERAVGAFTTAAGTATAAPSIRIRAARDAAGLIGRQDPSVAASLLENAVTLVPMIASRHLGRRNQEFALRQVAGLAADAAALALDPVSLGHAPVAVPGSRSLQLLELGRGVMLGRLLDTHDVNRLEPDHHGIARRLTELRNELDQIYVGD